MQTSCHADNISVTIFQLAVIYELCANQAQCCGSRLGPGRMEPLTSFPLDVLILIAVSQFLNL